MIRKTWQAKNKIPVAMRKLRKKSLTIAAVPRHDGGIPFTQT